MLTLEFGVMRANRQMDSFIITNKKKLEKLISDKEQVREESAQRIKLDGPYQFEYVTPDTAAERHGLFDEYMHRSGMKRGDGQWTRWLGVYPDYSLAPVIWEPILDCHYNTISFLLGIMIKQRR